MDFVPLQVFKLRLHPVEKNALCVGEVNQELQIQFTVSCNHKTTDLNTGTDVLVNNYNCS